jgi:UDP-N-acetyl-D-mannosaminuronic acid dehydrogenase
VSAGGFPFDVAVMGGCGHVGLPLGIALADRGSRVVLYDVNAAAVDLVNAGRLPFLEPDAEPRLRTALDAGRLTATTDRAVLGQADAVVVVVGTPVDEFLSPDPDAIPRTLKSAADVFVDGQLIVLRSTVYPGVTAMVERVVADLGVQLDVAYCPERIAEGRAMTELFTLPQLVAARAAPARKRADELFRTITDGIIHLEPEEAELAKLFTNSWRYLKFAVANQFFMIANDSGLDYEVIRSAVRTDYPRAADLPGAGFAAGPCLFKDAMQLAAFANNSFALGHAAMHVNEGLPVYLLSRIEQRYDLSTMTVGVLGMAFKAESDDRRSSLSYKLKRLLGVRAAEVLCTDPYVTDDGALLPLDVVLARADLLVIGAPHDVYRALDVETPVVDIWNLLGRGVTV